MATLTPNKTIQTPLIALQNVAANGVVLGSAFDFSGKLGATIFCRFGRRSASASTGSAFIRIEASQSATEDNSWFPILTFTTNYAAVEAEAVNGTCNSGQNVIGAASTSNLSAGVVVFIDNSTAANSCFGRIKSIVTNTSVTIEDNLVNAQTGSTMYAGAQIFEAQEIGPGYTRIRAVVDGCLFTQAFAVQVGLVTHDSMTLT